MSWDIDRIANMITEDPDVPASAQAMAIKSQASRIGGADPAATDQVRKQLEKQKKLQQQDQAQQRKNWTLSSKTWKIRRANWKAWKTPSINSSPRAGRPWVAWAPRCRI